MILKQFLANHVLNVRNIKKDSLRQIDLSDMPTDRQLEKLILPVPVKVPKKAPIFDVTERFTSDDCTRLQLKYVYAEDDTIVATDSRILAFAHVDLQTYGLENGKLYKCFDDEIREFERKFNLSEEEKQKLLKKTTALIGGRHYKTLDALYPQWKRVIPKKFKITENAKWMIDKLGYLRAYCNYLKIFEPENEKKMIVIESGKYTGIFNAEYLEKILTALYDSMPGGEITFCANGNNDPVMFKNDGMTVLLMPICSKNIPTNMFTLKRCNRPAETCHKEDFAGTNILTTDKFHSDCEYLAYADEMETGSGAVHVNEHADDKNIEPESKSRENAVSEQNTAVQEKKHANWKSLADNEKAKDYEKVLSIVEEDRKIHDMDRYAIFSIPVWGGRAKKCCSYTFKNLENARFVLENYCNKYAVNKKYEVRDIWIRKKVDFAELDRKKQEKQEIEEKAISMTNEEWLAGCRFYYSKKIKACFLPTGISVFLKSEATRGTFREVSKDFLLSLKPRRQKTNVEPEKETQTPHDVKPETPAIEHVECHETQWKHADQAGKFCNHSYGTFGSLLKCNDCNVIDAFSSAWTDHVATHGTCRETWQECWQDFTHTDRYRELCRKYSIECGFGEHAGREDCELATAEDCKVPAMDCRNVIQNAFCKAGRYALAIFSALSALAKYL